ncbi:MAG: AMP-binding protein [Methylotenera sp.]|uniref:AMP-binding protein n=1 Tax=Methylotenera sp. TaxID=2051956 RepID=UPI00271FF154|nr:AMP-binding protein [Methylotenera sp.]MDO9151478.1 AMP-binding protein [Methylotenera sp.]
MQKLPLIAHSALNKTIAWRKGAPVSVEQFLADVAYLTATLPAGKHVLNVCRDRYHFAVGFAAALVSNKVSLLPPTHTPEMVQQLQAFAADVFCLHDNKDCDIALPKLSYPVTPETSAQTQHSHSKDLHSRGLYSKAQLLEILLPEIPQIDAKQLAAIVFTSGSTGTPVPHKKSWGSLVRNVQAQGERLGLETNADYTILGTIPPQHMYGFESSVLLPLQSGNVLSGEQPFYPADIAAALTDITAKRILVSTPLHLRLLLDAEMTLPKLSMVISATAPLSTALAHKVEVSLKAPLIEIYGSTETGQIATRRTTKTEQWQLLPDVRLSARDERFWAEGGHVEIAVPLNDVIEPIDHDHFLLQGRMQDIINIAGKRSSLGNLNHHLNSISGVIDGAFFMPDERSHDHVTRLCACVVAPNLTTAQILAELRTRIDPVFLPRPLLFVESLPRNSTGKLPRNALKKLISQHMRPNEAECNH